MANEPVTNDNPASGAEGAENPVATTVTTETKPQPKPVIAGDWIPEDLRSNKTLSKFKTAGDLAQSYVNLERRLGSSVEIPGEQATPEQKSAFYQRLGVPETVEGYEAPAAPEGVELDTEYFGAFRTKAHELNLTKFQAKGLADWVVAREIAKHSEFSADSEKARKASMEKLRNGWGAAADQNVGLIQRLVDEYGDEETIADLDQTGAGNRAGILRMLAKIARTQVDADVMAAADIGTSQKSAQQDLENTLSAARADRKHVYRNENHPGHKAEVARVRRLYEIAYPDLEFRPEGM